MAKISSRQVKAWERFGSDLKAFSVESEGSEDAPVTLYEDAFTTRVVKDFEMTETGVLTWQEYEAYKGTTTQEREQMVDDDDSREWLKFWKANLRRAKRYWSMDAVELDRIHDGEQEDIDE